MKTITQFILIAFFAVMPISVSSQNTVHVHTDKGGAIHSYYGNRIDSITYSLSPESQLIWTSDTVYSTLLSSIDSVTIGKRAELAVIEGDLGDFSQIRVADSGEMGLIVENDTKDIPSEILMFLSNESGNTSCARIIYDDMGFPTTLSLDEMTIFIHYLGESKVSFTVVSDSLAFSIDSLSLDISTLAVHGRKAWADNNWQRNTAAILQVLSGAASVVIGGATVVGGVAAEGVTLGAATVAVVGGGITVAGGVISVREGWQKLFGRPETYMNSGSTLGRDILLEDGSLLFSNETFTNPNMSFGEYMNTNLNKAGIVNFLIGLGANVLDFWGETTTEAQRVMEQHRAYHVLTGISKDITMSSALLKGYVSPEATHPVNSAKVVNEYGIVVRSESSAPVYYKTINGNGGLIEEKVEGLSAGTSYAYFTYFIDKTHQITRVGKYKGFITKSMPVKLIDFRITKSEYKEKGFTNEGEYYDYRFHAATTVEIEDVENVYDWGYVYEDPQGKKAHISVKAHGTSYTDTDYAYYRNEPHSTARLYSYVQYKGDSNYFYGEVHDFPLDYEGNNMWCPDTNHPHAIDLGLPSGTKWSCCNVGASFPEEYGGYYAWGETKTKNYYSHGTYQYAYVDDNNGWYWDQGHYWRYDDIGTDIAGTGYDAATANWGTLWRMPSLSRIRELLNNSSSKWIKQNGVNGYLFTGPNGNSVFLPAAGRRCDGELIQQDDSRGYYWLSSLYGEDGPGLACYLYFRPGSAYWNNFYYSRYSGHTIRPIRLN